MLPGRENSLCPELEGVGEVCGEEVSAVVEGIGEEGGSEGGEGFGRVSGGQVDPLW